MFSKDREIVGIESHGAVFERRQLHFPARYKEACQTYDSACTFSRIHDDATWENSAKAKSLRPKPVWENPSHAMQGPCERYLRESLL